MEKDSFEVKVRFNEIGNLVKDNMENIASIDWTVYGKIKSIVRGGNAQQDLNFLYDAAGNRILKERHYQGSHPKTWEYTYYVRDAQGNVMAVYDYKPTQTAPAQVLSLVEHPVYGSSRIGMRTYIDADNVDALTSPYATNTNTYTQNLKSGLMSYEMSNHLANVLTVVSDRKIPIDVGNNGTVDYYVADILNSSDYYAFGSPMPGRSYNGGNYRYGFNGKENDNEVKGTGNSLDFGARVLDPRLGRWLSIDPMKQKYPFYSPYTAFGDNPNYYVDPGGETLRVGGHIEQSKKDVLNFVPKQYQSLISFKDGANEFEMIEGKIVFGNQAAIPYTVVFNITQKQALASGDPGVIALYEMVNSTKEMYYGAQTTVEVGDFTGKKGKIVDYKDGIIAAKSSPRAFDNKGNPAGFESLDGVDGLRTIAEGSWQESTPTGDQSKSRSSLVFHELFEMYQEVINNEYYDQKGSSATGTFNNQSMQLGNNGSHSLSIQAEKSLKAGDSRKSDNPGTVSKFKRNN
jgi:RHS repeat-associated protein